MAGSEKTLKSIRISPDSQRLLKLLAAFEDRAEGDIFEDALGAYLSMRTLAYGQEIPEARELAHATPADVGDAVTALMGAIENVVAAGGRSPEPGKGKERLKAKAARKAAAASPEPAPPVVA